MAVLLDALDLADVGETRVVVGHALRSSCHDRCECGIFRFAPHTRAARMLTSPCSDTGHVLLETRSPFFAVEQNRDTSVMANTPGCVQ